MKHFLIDYDRSSGEVTVQTFERMDDAIRAYTSSELEALGTMREVVLLGSESEDDLRETHARYFLEIAEAFERAVGRDRELSRGFDRALSDYREQLAGQV
ncbi:MAG: hypothetical protein F4X80_06450 [Chloroflexi bacterium]|nr:hypothetical protein [Chloroflexota bacterium]